jgi:hypothetical protein
MFQVCWVDNQGLMGLGYITTKNLAVKALLFANAKLKE